MANTSDGREPQARVERTLPRGIETCGLFTSYAKFLTNERSGPGGALELLGEAAGQVPIAAGAKRATER
jgi:hypothetical protein